jgi:serine/threonine-protein kinase HipA
MTRILDVYLYEKFVGNFIQNNSGQLQFKYDDSYVADKNAVQISISMPVRLQEYKQKIVSAFFSGLLPEENARYTLAKNLGVSEKNSFSLLEIIGGECAGALGLYPHGVKPPPATNADFEILDDYKLKRILGFLKKRPLMTGSDNIRLSLAGAQDKLAVGMVSGQIALIHGTSPTTHILKPIIDHVKDSVYNEYFCLKLAAKMNLTAPQVEVRWLGDTPYFLIERYDRVHSASGQIQRLHQEDFCQALAIMPELKYEREGGPNVANCLKIIQDHTLNPVADSLAFIQRLIFSYLIGNADAHGKNYSLLYKGNSISLAPAYDLLSTEVYPDMSMKMAMKIGGKYEPFDVLARHWHRIVPDNYLAKNSLNKVLLKMSDECTLQSEALRIELSKNVIDSSIFDQICSVISKRAAYIKSQIPST